MEPPITVVVVIAAFFTGLGQLPGSLHRVIGTRKVGPNHMENAAITGAVDFDLDE
jgi:hypothetical protein